MSNMGNIFKQRGQYYASNPCELKENILKQFYAQNGLRAQELRQLSVCHRKLYLHYLFFYICVCVDMKLVKCIFVITS